MPKAERVELSSVSELQPERLKARFNMLMKEKIASATSKD
jgi:hypothetical protein